MTNRLQRCNTGLLLASDYSVFVFVSHNRPTLRVAPFSLYIFLSAMMTPEQFSQFQQQQLHALHELTLKYVSSIQSLTELHLQHTKNSLQAHSQHHQELLQVKSLQELVQLQSKSLQPMTEKITDYTHHLYNIFFGLGQEVNRLFDVQQAQTKPQEQAQVAPTTLPAPKAKTAAKSSVGQRGSSA